MSLVYVVWQILREKQVRIVIFTNNFNKIGDIPNLIN